MPYDRYTIILFLVVVLVMVLTGCYKQPISSFDEICFKESVKLCKVTLEIGR